jgi:hypothetical protein
VHSYENKYIEYVGQQAVDELTEKISVSDRWHQAASMQ